MKTRFLFPNKFKKIGWLMLIPSTIFGLFTIFTNFEPEWLNLSVFTFYSDGMPLYNQESVSFGMIKNNITNELAALFFLISALMIAFSKAKNEDEFISKIRLESLVWSTFVHFGILIVGILFLYDFEFFTFMIFNMFTLLIVFIGKFNWALYTSKKLSDEE